MFPHTVAWLLLIAIRTGGVIDAFSVAACTAEAIFDMADHSGGSST
jgi:hypothetical protein